MMRSARFEAVSINFARSPLIKKSKASAIITPILSAISDRTHRLGLFYHRQSL